MDYFPDCVAFVLDREGGYVNDPADPGGATNYGISLKFYRNNIDPGAGAGIIKSLSREKAMDIYRKYFWQPPGCDKLPPGLALMVFDAAVNQGPERAVTFLQRALRLPAQMVDGRFGPATAKAVREHYSPNLIHRLAAFRGQAYGKTSNFSRFGLGWMERLMHAHALSIKFHDTTS